MALFDGLEPVAPDSTSAAPWAAAAAAAMPDVPKLKPSPDPDAEAAAKPLFELAEGPE